MVSSNELQGKVQGIIDTIEQSVAQNVDALQYLEAMYRRLFELNQQEYGEIRRGESALMSRTLIGFTDQEFFERYITGSGGLGDNNDYLPRYVPLVPTEHLGMFNRIQNLGIGLLEMMPPQDRISYRYTKP